MYAVRAVDIHLDLNNDIAVTKKAADDGTLCYCRSQWFGRGTNTRSLQCALCCPLLLNMLHQCLDAVDIQHYACALCYPEQCRPDLEKRRWCGECLHRDIDTGRLSDMFCFFSISTMLIASTCDACQRPCRLLHRGPCVVRHISKHPLRHTGWEEYASRMTSVRAV